MNTLSIKATFFFSLFLFLSSPADAGITKSTLIYVPATPASVPLILAAQTLPGMDVKIFTSHSKAHSLFLKGDVQILSTGLSVGVRFFRQNVPVKIVNSYVSGLTYLVTNRSVKTFRDLKGQMLYLPFTGSPIEEITQFFVAAEGLVWNRDIPIGHTLFPGAVNLLQQGRISAAALPEPFVSMLQTRRDIHTLSYKALWEKHTGHGDGYPQMGTFVLQSWAESHGPAIRQLNAALARAILFVIQSPDAAVKKVEPFMKFSAGILQAALRQTDFYLLQGSDLKREVENYYQTLGVPLDDTFEDFF